MIIKKLFKWIKLLLYNQEYDNIFLYEIERKKLIDMLEYRENNENIFLYSDIDIKYLKICISLLNILLRYENIDYTKKYVNVNNSDLFKYVYEGKSVDEYDKEIIYTEKALKLYHIIKYRYIKI